MTELRAHLNGYVSVEPLGRKERSVEKTFEVKKRFDKGGKLKK